MYEGLRGVLLLVGGECGWGGNAVKAGMISTCSVFELLACSIGAYILRKEDITAFSLGRLGGKLQ